MFYDLFEYDATNAFKGMFTGMHSVNSYSKISVLPWKQSECIQNVEHLNW